VEIRFLWYLDLGMLFIEFVCVARMGRAGLIKSIMMQAILYGSHAEVCLDFGLIYDLLFMILRDW
jgi:hypothetical protein